MLRVLAVMSMLVACADDRQPVDPPPPLEEHPEPFGPVAFPTTPSVPPTGQLFPTLALKGTDAIVWLENVDDPSGPSWFVGVQADEDALTATHDGVTTELVGSSAARTRFVLLHVAHDGSLRAFAELPLHDPNVYTTAATACANALWVSAMDEQHVYLVRADRDLKDFETTTFTARAAPDLANPRLSCIDDRPYATMGTSAGADITLPNGEQAELAATVSATVAVDLAALFEGRVVVLGNAVESVRALASGGDGTVLQALYAPGQINPSAHIARYHPSDASIERINELVPLGNEGDFPVTFGRGTSALAYCAPAPGHPVDGPVPLGSLFLTDPLVSTFCVFSRPRQGLQLVELRASFVRGLVVGDWLWLTGGLGEEPDDRLGDAGELFPPFLVGMDLATSHIDARAYWHSDGQHYSSDALFAARAAPPCASGDAVAMRLAGGPDGVDGASYVLVFPGETATACASRIADWAQYPYVGQDMRLSDTPVADCEHARYLAVLDAGTLTIATPTGPASVTSGGDGVDLVVFAPSECAITRAD